MRPSRFLCQLAVVITTFAVPSSLAAQVPRGISIGIQGLYNFNDLNEPGLGTHLLIDLPAGFAVYPGFQSYFVASGHLRRFSTTVRWMPRQPALRAYVAVGPYWSWTSGLGEAVTDMGVLAQVGAEGRGRKLRPFAEVQLLKDGAVSTELAAGARILVASW